MIPLMADDMKRIQRAESWRERRKRALSNGAGAAEVAPFLKAEAEALDLAFDAIIRRLNAGVGK